jgi:two-component system cell cycle response regulator
MLVIEARAPGELGGFAVCRRLKENPATTHVCVVMATSPEHSGDRIRALQAGADELITPPFDPELFLAFVRHSIRGKLMVDELRTHARTGRDVGLAESEEPTLLDMDGADGRVLLVADDRALCDRIRLAVTPRHRLHIERDSEDALLVVQRAEFDLIAVDLALSSRDALRVCSRLRTYDVVRRTPMLAIARDARTEVCVRALEIGASNFLTALPEDAELLALVESWVRRKRYVDQLRDNVRRSIQRAVMDPLTSMHNRRYLERHLAPLVTRNAERGRPVSLLLIDVDHFKAVNDSCGHEVGDEVLREIAGRITSSLRGLDLCCRFGGEEFVAAFAGADAAVAEKIAERLRRKVADAPFRIVTDRGPLSVTVSIGVAVSSARGDDAEGLLRRADLALYRAKKEGRNRVVVGA